MQLLRSFFFATILLLTTLLSSNAQNISGLNLRWNYEDGFGEFFFCENGNFVRKLYNADTVYFGNWFVQNDTMIRLIYMQKQFTRTFDNEKFKTIDANISLDTIFTSYFDFPEDILSKNNTCNLYNFSVHLTGNYYYASEKELTSNQIESFPIEKLTLMKTEIFARYGYNFRKKNEKSMLKYFKKQKWYKAKYHDISIFLTPIERENIILIDNIINAKTKN